MGKSCDGVQAVQLAEGRSNSRRGRHAAKIARMMDEYLSEIYVREDVVINDDGQLASWGVDPEIFTLFYNGWKSVVVSKNGVLITFGES